MGIRVVRLGISTGLVAGACVCAPLSASLPAQDPPAASTQGFVTITGGARLHFAVHGSGPDTVIVPGGFMLAPHLGELANAGLTLVFYDMRARGRSDWIPDPRVLTFADDVRDIEAVRSHLKISRAALIGFSYLALVTAVYAADHPDRVTRLVHLAPGAPDAQTGARHAPRELKVRSQAAEATLARLRQAAGDSTDPTGECTRWYQAYGRVYVGDTTDAARVPSDFCIHQNESPVRMGWRLQQTYKSMGRRWDFSRKAAAIKAPTLVIQGDADLVASPDGARRWATLVPDSRLIMLAGAGHLLYVERRERVGPALARFLHGEWPPEAMRIRTAP